MDLNWSWPGEKISKVLSKREKALIILLLLFVMVYTYYTWMLLPLLSEIAAMERENHQLRDEVWDLQHLLQEKRVDNSAEGKDQLFNLFQQVPAVSAIPEAISSLQNMAEESGVVINRVYFQQVSEGKFKPGELQDEEIEIQVVGGYNQLRAFIAEIEQIEQIEQSSRRLMVLNQSRIISGEEDFFSKVAAERTEQRTNLFALPQLQADLSIKLFYDGISLPEN
ncbi:MAG: type 4a pilus biogenesis protein PilO [Syntrophomonadaceae bacterium]|nr:type 4a pilus biogenesis protein PilO [Syntrophomonadaceae bacterium]